MSDKLSDNYRTPPELFNTLNEVTPFFWDACCTEDNCLVEDQRTWLSSHTEERGWDGYDYLEEQLDWRYDSEAGSIFINPPYSRGSIGPVIEKAWSDAKHFRVVMLLKADMSTDWFNYLLKESDFFPEQINQQDMSLYLAYQEVLARMDDAYTKSDIGILHLRKRVKFLADKEMMAADKDTDIINYKGVTRPFIYFNKDIYAMDADYLKAYDAGKLNKNNYDMVEYTLIETKNFKRGKDGLIYPKSGPTFPSMLVILDRRGE